MNKKLGSITSLTNRQFYEKHKKSPEDFSKANFSKVLKAITVNKNRQMGKAYSITKKVRETLLTENKEEGRSDYSYINENAEKKKIINGMIKKMHPGWKRLVISFEKTLQSQSV